jgi:hypothetical protein
MNQTIDAYSLSGFQQGLGAFGGAHVEHEHCPPIALVFMVFGATALGGILFADLFNSMALGWIAGVLILAMLGVAIDHRFSGSEALERRIRHRQRVRREALARAASQSSLTRQWRSWNGSAAREWTSTSAYRRRPPPTTAARAGWSPDSTRRDSRAEYRIQQA